MRKLTEINSGYPLLKFFCSLKFIKEYIRFIRLPSHVRLQSITRLGSIERQKEVDFDLCNHNKCHILQAVGFILARQLVCIDLDLHRMFYHCCDDGHLLCSCCDWWCRIRSAVHPRRSMHASCSLCSSQKGWSSSGLLRASPFRYRFQDCFPLLCRTLFRSLQLALRTLTHPVPAPGNSRLWLAH